MKARKLLSLSHCQMVVVRNTVVAMEVMRSCGILAVLKTEPNKSAEKLNMGVKK